MQAHVVTIGPDASLHDLAELLVRERVLGVPVIEGVRLVGVVSRSDLVHSLSLEHSLVGYLAEEVSDPGAPEEVVAASERILTECAHELAGQTVRDVMSVDPVVVAPDDSIEAVADRLVAHRVHRVLVTENARLLGIISALDLVALIADGSLRSI